MEACKHGVTVCEKCRCEKEALHSLLVETLREGRSGGWIEGSPLDLQIKNAVGDPPKYETTLPKAWHHADGTLTIMVDGAPEEVGSIDVRKCFHCKKPYLDWGISSGMSCPECRIQRARTDEREKVLAELAAKEGHK